MRSQCKPQGSTFSWRRDETDCAAKKWMNWKSNALIYLGHELGRRNKKKPFVSSFLKTMGDVGDLCIPLSSLTSSELKA